jgi:5-methylcytosine-specific restriction endonuclease McrA
MRNRLQGYRECVVCERSFLVGRWNGANRCCSRECGWKLERRRITIKCQYCGKESEFPRCFKRRLYCSRKCLWAANPIEWVTIKCHHCGNEFRKKKSQAGRAKRQFCSRLCNYRGNRGEQHFSWRGNSRRSRGIDWPEQSAECRKRDGFKCQVCGKPQAKGQRLDVDHIVPFRSVLRNDLVNLISVCKAPCHVRKTTTAERRFLRGDYLGFKRLLNQQGWPMERVEAAIKWWGTL